MRRTRLKCFHLTGRFNLHILHGYWWHESCYMDRCMANSVDDKGREFLSVSPESGARTGTRASLRLWAESGRLQTFEKTHVAPVAAIETTTRSWDRPETVPGHHKINFKKSGFVAILIVTSMDFGGLTEILKISNDGGRFQKQFEFDPRYRQGSTDCSITELYPARIQNLRIFQPVDNWYRHTFWSVIFGNSTGFAVASYTCQQYKVQRYLSCKSLKEAQKCIYMAAFGIMAICVAGKCAWRPRNETFPIGILIELWIQVSW